MTIIFKSNTGGTAFEDWPNAPRIAESVRIQLSNRSCTSVYKVMSVEWDQGAAILTLNWLGD